MPDPDERFPFIPSIFWPDRPSGPGSYEALQARRKIAESLLGRRSPFPKTLGEGLTYAGERIGDVLMERELDRREAAYEAQQQEEAKQLGVRLEEAARRRAATAAEATPSATPATLPTSPTDITETAELQPVTPPSTPPSVVQPPALSPRNKIAAVMAQTRPVTGTVALPPNLTAGRPLAQLRPDLGRTAFQPGMGAPQSIAGGAGLPPAGPAGNAPNMFGPSTSNPVTGAVRPVPTQPPLGRFSTEFGPNTTNAIGTALLSPQPALPSNEGLSEEQLLEHGRQTFRGVTSQINPENFAKAQADFPSSENIEDRRLETPFDQRFRGAAGTYYDQRALPFAPDGGAPTGNPPIVTDIPAAPPMRVAQAASVAPLRPGGGYAPPPTAMDPRVQAPPPPSAGGVLQPAQAPGLRQPPVPRGMTPEEIAATVRMRTTRDPNRQAREAELINVLKGEREAADARDKMLWEAEARVHEQARLKQYEAGLAQNNPEAVQRLQDMREKAAEEAANRQFGGTISEAQTFLTKPYEAVQGMLNTTHTLREAKAAADKMWAGPGAPTLQQISRWLGELPGVNEWAREFAAQNGRTASAGEMFAAYIRRSVGPMRSQMGLAGNVSNFDLENMLQATAASPTLQRATIKAVIDQALTANFDGIRRFETQKTSFTGAGDTPESQRRRQTLDDRFPVDLEHHLPDHVLDAFKQELKQDRRQAMTDLDRKLRSPGLAERVIRLYRIGQ
jgi:hypothetical protein